MTVTAAIDGAGQATPPALVAAEGDGGGEVADVEGVVGNAGGVLQAHIYPTRRGAVHHHGVVPVPCQDHRLPWKNDHSALSLTTCRRVGREKGFVATPEPSRLSIRATRLHAVPWPPI